GVVRRIAEEMMAEPAWQPMIMPPFEIMGVEAFGDSSVNIRARFKTLPGKQWAVGREFNRRMKKVFDAEGIEIPFPTRTIYFGVDQDGKAPPAHLRIVPRATPAEDAAPPAPGAPASAPPPEEFPPAVEQAGAAEEKRRTDA